MLNTDCTNGVGKTHSLFFGKRRKMAGSIKQIISGLIENKISEINADTSLNDNEISFIVKPENAIDIDEKKDLVLAEWYLGQKNE